MKPAIRYWIWGAVGAGTVLAVALAPEQPVVDPAAIVEAKDSASAAPGSSGSSSPPPLPAREQIALPNVDPFAPRQAPAAPPPVLEPAPAAAPALPPEPPPLPYRFMGRVQGVDGQVTVFLSREDRLLTVKTGDTLEDQYYVKQIDADGIDVIYVPLERPQRIAIR